MNRRILVWGVLFLSLCGAMFLASKLLNRTKTNLSSTGNLKNGIEAKGVVIRKETIFTAPIGGIIEILTANGIRVDQGDSIALINNEEIKDAAVTQINLRNLETKSKIEQMNVQVYANNKEVSGLNQKINQNLELLNYLIREKRFNQISLQENALNELVFSRHQLLNKNVVLNEQILAEEQRLTIDNQELNLYLGRAIWKLRTISPGIVVWGTDGWEDQLTPYSFDFLNSGFLHSVTLADNPPTVSGEKVEANQTLGKIVDESVLFIATTVSKKEGKQIYEGLNLNLLFADCPSLENYPAQVVRIIGREAEPVIIMKLDYFPTFLRERRIVPLKITSKNSSDKTEVI